MATFSKGDKVKFSADGVAVVVEYVKKAGRSNAVVRYEGAEFEVPLRDLAPVQKVRTTTKRTPAKKAAPAKKVRATTKRTPAKKAAPPVEYLDDGTPWIPVRHPPVRSPDERAALARRARSRAPSTKRTPAKKAAPAKKTRATAKRTGLPTCPNPTTRRDVGYLFLQFKDYAAVSIAIDGVPVGTASYSISSDPGDWPKDYFGVPMAFLLPAGKYRIDYSVPETIGLKGKSRDRSRRQRVRIPPLSGSFNVKVVGGAKAVYLVRWYEKGGAFTLKSRYKAPIPVAGYKGKVYAPLADEDIENILNKTVPADLVSYECVTGKIASGIKPFREFT